MSDVALVSVAEIRALANSLFDAIESKGMTAAAVERREYWCVYFADMFGAAAPMPVVGDVLDDLADARRELAEASDPAVIWHAAHHIAGLVQLLAYADAEGKLI